MRVLMSDKTYVRVTNVCLFGVALMVLIAQHLPPANWVAPTFIGLSGAACVLCVALYVARGRESDRQGQQKAATPLQPAGQRAFGGAGTHASGSADREQPEDVHAVTFSKPVAVAGKANAVDMAGARLVDVRAEWSGVAPATADMSLEEIIKMLAPVSAQKQTVFRRRLYSARGIEVLFDPTGLLAADRYAFPKKRTKPLEKSKLQPFNSEQDEADACLA
ncbi:hypothetical protein SAMN05216466_105244 [Paraburkholderia phenazinium]|uniref:Uncharacterized protein n=2 Tax=Paraburkholderia phenazinium TaxID=60549 RepID=A0A1G7XAG3_9BURK|nr:hypothetical protein SAMN05216466_105244 [Paraburkholderia phenazinium]